MKLSRILLIVAVAAYGFLGCPSARAEDNPLEFLHALQENGYPDIAVEYLKMLKDKPDAPKEVMEIWDWEMCRSLRASSKLAYDEAQAKKWAEEAQGYLEKFIKENPNHPAAVKADAEQADAMGMEALKEIRKAKEAADDKLKVESLAKAQELLKTVRAKFAHGKKKLTEQWQAMPFLKKSKLTPAERKRNEAWLLAQEQVFEAEIKLAISDFYLAQTYADPKSKDAQAAFQSAGKVFDDIFQRTRGNEALGFLGLQSHFWHARTMHEQGSIDQAMDIYDEVMMSAPEVSQEVRAGRGAAGAKVRLTGFEHLFSECELYRLQIIRDKTYRKYSLADYMAEIKIWTQPQYEPYYLNTDGYQGILFEHAKFSLGQAEKAEKKGDANTKQIWTKEATRVLKKMKRIPSQYLQQATVLRKELGVSDAESGLDEFVEKADEAAKQGNYQQALGFYEKALEAVLKLPPPKPSAKQQPGTYTPAQIRTAMAGCLYNLAYAHFGKGELAEATENLRQLLKEKEYRESPVGQTAGELLLKVATNEYATAINEFDAAQAELSRVPKNDEEKAAQAKEKLDEAAKKRDAVEQKLVKNAEVIISLWPGKAIADFGRFNLGRIQIYKDNLPEAMQIFKVINEQSPHFPTALYLAGHTYWRKYVQGKKAAGAKSEEADKEYALDCRKRAVVCMQKAVEVLKAGPLEKDGRWPKQRIDAQLLLGEMFLEGGEAKDAVAQFEPLVAEIQKTVADGGAKSFDKSAIQAINGAIRAYNEVKDTDKAGKLGEVLMKHGPDAPQINISLVDLARKLDEERKDIESKLDRATPAEREELKKRLTSCEGLIRQLNTNLSARTLSVPGMIWVIKSCINVGMTEDAKEDAIEEMARGLIERIKEDETYRKAVPGIRLLLVQYYLAKNDHEKALEHAKELEKESKSLEPKLAKGRILQAMAESDADKFAEATAHWDLLRRGLEARLLKLQQSKLPKDAAEIEKLTPTLVEVVCNEGQCFLSWAKKTDDKEQAKKGDQVLRQFLMRGVLGPSPEAKSVAALADKLRVFYEPTYKPAPPKRGEPAKKTAPTVKTGEAKTAEAKTAESKTVPAAEAKE
jgi:hypothetical protein